MRDTPSLHIYSCVRLDSGPAGHVDYTLHFLRRYSGNRWTSFERDPSYCNGPYCYQGTLACED